MISSNTFMVTIATNWLLATEFKWMAYKYRLSNYYYTNKTASLLMHTQMYTNRLVLQPEAATCTSSYTVGYDTLHLASCKHQLTRTAHSKASFAHKCLRPLQLYMQSKYPKFLPQIYSIHILYMRAFYVFSAVHLSMFTLFTYPLTTCTQCTCTRPWSNETFAWNLHRCNQTYQCYSVTLLGTLKI